MTNTQQIQAFAEGKLLTRGTVAEVAALLKTGVDAKIIGEVLLFRADNGQQLDLDLSGSEQEVLARYNVEQSGSEATEAASKPKRGRPKLGVVGREVTLLPRHWEWLDRQRGGSSAALRRLIDAARQSTSAEELVRHSQDATNRFMTAMAGDLPGFEEATRALYAQNQSGFEQHTASWPTDIRKATRHYAVNAWGAE